jgi:hypothetical protein
VPADTPDIRKFFFLSPNSAEKFRLSARLDQENLRNLQNFSNFCLSQAHQRSAVGEQRGKLRKKGGQNERRKKVIKKERKKKFSINSVS